MYFNLLKLAPIHFFNCIHLGYVKNDPKHHKIKRLTNQQALINCGYSKG